MWRTVVVQPCFCAAGPGGRRMPALSPLRTLDSSSPRPTRASWRVEVRAACRVRAAERGRLQRVEDAAEVVRGGAAVGEDRQRLRLVGVGVGPDLVRRP